LKDHPFRCIEHQHNIDRSESRSTEALIKEQNSFINPFHFMYWNERTILTPRNKAKGDYALQKEQ
jgi:hypothetical protein